MELLAHVLFAVAASGYLVAGGAGFGLGALLRWLGGTPAARWSIAVLVRGAAWHSRPWLAATVGAAAALWPLAVERWTGLLPAAALWVMGAALRWAGFRASAHRGGDAVCAGSWALLLGWGWALSWLIAGGGPDGLPPAASAPLVAFSAVAVALLMTAHGLGAGLRQLSGETFQRARQLSGGGEGLLPLTVTVLAALPALAALRVPVGGQAVGWLVPLLVPLLVVACWRTGRMVRNAGWQPRA